MRLGPSKKTLLLLICCMWITITFSQHTVFDKIPDSLQGKDYEYLENAYKKNSTDTLKQSIYGGAYFLKGKINQNISKIYTGISYIYNFTKHPIREKYLDSVIYYSRYYKNQTLLARGFFIRGNYNFRRGNLKIALKDYLESQRIAKLNKDLDGEFRIKYRIGWLKNNLGEDLEALNLFRAYTIYLKEKISQEDNEKDRSNYINSLYALSDSYNRNRKLDSAAYIINIGIKESLKYELEIEYNYLVFSSGINNYFKGNFDQAIDSLKKTKVFLLEIDDKENLAVYFHYLGKSMEGKGDLVGAIPYFEKMDSISQITSYANLVFREGYESLIDYYKETSNDKQLEYIEKLLKMDSLLYRNQGHLIKEIAKKYETPQLLAEKEALISGLEKKQYKSSIGLWALGITLAVVVGLLFYYYKRQQQYKKRFEALLRKDTSSQTQKTAQQAIPTEGVLNVSPEIETQIQKGLESFIVKKQFLNSKVTLNSLSKKLDTNSNYLSKVINYYEQKNFSNYINDLRVEYAVNELKTNTQFRLYSVKGMAQEVGFKTSESFSKAFYKKTGLYPSYFLKQFDKKEYALH